MLTDHRLNYGLPPLGYLAPRLWKEAEAAAGSDMPLLVDITEVKLILYTDSVRRSRPSESAFCLQGSTNLSCSNGFASGTGWDPVTGWGRPIWDGLVQYLGKD